MRRIIMLLTIALITVALMAGTAEAQVDVDGGVVVDFEDDGRVCIQSFPESLLCELGLSFDAFVAFGDDVVSIQPVGGVEEEEEDVGTADDDDGIDDDPFGEVDVFEL
jgi:hypothetical protein